MVDGNEQPVIPSQNHGGNGPLITFVHANGYPPACYEPLINQLKDQYKIISIIQRPLWNNSNPNEISDWHIFSADLIRFLDQQQIKITTAIGHSFGAIAALRAAINHPDRFKALILIDPVLFSPAKIIAYRFIKSDFLIYHFQPLIKTALKRRKEFDDESQIYNLYRTKKVFKYLDDDNLRTYVKGIITENEQGKIILKYDPIWEARIYATAIWNDMDLWGGINSISIPILFIRGEESNSFPLSSVKSLKNKLPRLNLVTLPMATHLVPLEYPHKVGSIINKFLEENS